MRYGAILSDRVPFLALRDETQRFPSRHKQHISEDLAIGYCGYVLRECFEVRNIADAEMVLGDQLRRLREASRKCPDFFCERLDGSMVIAEAKGTLGGMRSLAPKMRKGKGQVRALVPVKRVVHARIVVGLALACESENRMTTAAIHDPDGEEAVHFELPTDAVVRQAYAKVFTFLGLPAHARRVIQPAIEDAAFVEERRVIQTVKVGNLAVKTPAAGIYAVGLVEPLYQALIESTGEFRLRVSTALNEIVPRDEEELMVLNNGVVLWSDSWRHRVYEHRYFRSPRAAPQ